MKCPYIIAIFVWVILHRSLIFKKNWAGGRSGIGGHIPGEKVEDISKRRMVPKGMDALSPALFSPIV